MRWLPWSGVALLAALTWSPAAAQELDHDFQLWLLFSAETQLDAGPVTLVPYVEFQPRFADAVRELREVQGRAALFVKPVDDLRLGGGVLYGTTFRDRRSRREWRPYQEALWQPEVLDGDLRLTPRVRLEQRFIERTEAVSHRLRLRPGVEVPLFEVRGVGVELELSYEVFVNLNDVPDGPRQGFDQQRAFVGLIFRLTEVVDVEIGYQAQHVNQRGEADELNHEVWLSLQLGFGGD